MSCPAARRYAACDYNFCGNGIVYAAARDASPKMAEVKFNYQSIQADVAKDTVTVINKNLFIGTSDFICSVTLQKDGKVMAKKEIKTDVPPLCRKTYDLPFGEQTEAGEYAVTVSFAWKEDAEWAPGGHEAAFGQFVYKVTEKETHVSAPFEVMRGYLNIGVRGAHFDALFSALNGGLVSYRYGGKELIKSIPMSSAVQTAMNAAGRSDIVCIGVDGNVGPLTMIKNGELRATVYQDGAGQVTKAIDLMVDYFNGKTVAKSTMIDFVLVTKDNVDKYLA